MKISGGTTLGNCAIGKPIIVTSPTMTMMMEITMATIGRLIKNLDIGLFTAAGLAGQRRREVGRGHRHAVANLLQTLHNHALARLQSLFNGPEIAAPFSNPHRLDVHLVLRIDDRDLVAALQFGHGTLRYQQGVP